MPTYRLMGFANSSVGWSADQINASGPANVSGDGLTIEVIDDDLILDDESAGSGETRDLSSQVLGNSFGVVGAGQVIQSVYSWTVTNTTTGEVGTGYLLRIYNGTDPTNPGGQDGEYYQAFTIAVHDGDVLSYGPGNFIGQAAYADIYSANAINGTPGDDAGDTALVGTSGDDIINAFAGNDELFGLGGNDVLNGDEGNDALRGSAGDDTLNGGDGNDFLNGGVGNDYVNGGNGYDRATFYTGATAGVHVDLNIVGPQDTGQGMDTLVDIENLSGTAFNDTLTGDGGDNWLWGSTATLGDGSISPDNNDTLDGQGGNDLLLAGIGNHSLTGGTGIDTVSFTENGNPEPGVTVSLELQGAAQTTGAGNWTLDGIENLSGGIADDSLTGDGSDNVLAGNTGDDNLVGGGGNDTLYGDGQIAIDYAGGPGTSGPIATFADVTSIDPSLVDGNDTLEGGAGNDTLNGGGGSDTASYEHNDGPVDLNLQFGFADEYGADGVTYLTTDTLVSIENVTGSAFDDTIIGDDGNNVLDGLGGNDFIQGRGGDDTLYGGDGNDTLQGDRGDLFTGPSGNDTLYGGDGNDTLRGGLGNDVLYGGDGNDHFRGNGGVDSFDGGADDGEGFNGIGDRISFYEQRATQGVVADLRTGIISNDGYGNVETMVGIESLGAGTAFADTFYGNDDRNFLLADLGDSSYGFGGDDLFQISSAPATLDGGTGTDTVFLTSSGGWLSPDTNADGLAEIADAATEGWFINLLGGTMFDGYGNFGTVTGIENVDGSELADTIRGDDNDNVLRGLGGDDLVVGNGGNDTIEGGDGSDLLRGDAQNYIGGPFGNDIILGGAGDDHMRGGAGVDYFDGGTDSGGESIYGGIGDRISFYEMAATAGVVADLRTGIISNDGFGNVETMVGVESLGGDTAFVDTFYGNDSRNTLLGGRGDNLYGFGGDDNFSMSAAAATVDGGDGTDLLQVNSAGGWLLPDADSDGVAEVADAATAGWTINLAAGTLLDGYGNSGGVTGVENVDGSELDDTLIGDDNANVINGGDGDDTIEGRGGNDTLDGGNGIDTVSYANAVGPVEVYLGSDAFEYDLAFNLLSQDTLANFENATGSAFDDTLFGDGNANVLSGLGGNDFIGGGGGDDQINGGAGFDTANYAGAGAAVTVDLAAGTASGGADNDTLSGIEAVNGSNFDDLLIGDSGANSLTGRNGNDTLLAGDGDDFMRGGAGDDVMDGGSGFDRVSHYGTNITNGVTVDLRIAGAQNTGHGWDTYTGIEALSGSRYDDTLIGDDNANWLVAADGDDTLVGNGGDDLLTVHDGELGPASGNHFIDGGTGSDTAGFSAVVLGGTGVNVSLALQGAAQDSGHGMLTLTNVENLSGSQYDDALTGDGNDNTLSGHAGDDTLIGGAGNDRLYGDGAMVADTTASSGGSGPITFFADVTSYDPSLVAGNDTLEGGDGDDELWGGGGNDTASYASAGGAVQTFLYNSGFGEADGAAGYDQLHDIENLTGSAFNDTLFGNNQANVLDGGDGHDFLQAREGDDTVLGGNGDDYLGGGTGNDLLDGGAGFDRASFSNGSTAGVTVDLRIQGVAQDTGLGLDTLVGIEAASGTGFSDTLTGDDNANWLWGGFGGAADTIDGQGGDDLIEAGAADHVLSGGTGTDTFRFVTDGIAGINVSLALQGASQDTGVGMMTLTGFENLVGFVGADTLTGDGADNILAGAEGDDALNGGAGNDTLYGDGSINIDSHGTGGSGPITLYPDLATEGGVDGNDTLEGGLGNDTLNGGGGSDTASYAHASGDVQATISAGGGGGSAGADGNDTFVSIENLTGGAFNDQLIGNGGANVLNGGDGHDSLRGFGGGDTLLGGNGDDFLNGGQGDDMVDGGAGWDRATFASGAVAGVTVDLTLQGAAQNTGQGMDTLVNIEHVSGTAFNDTLTGDGGDNWIWGQGGNDVLTGNGGNDLIQAGAAGNLTASGGTGTDTLSLNDNGAGSSGMTVSLALQGAAQASGIGSYTLTGFENLSGSNGNDTLTGDGGANVLAGDQGDDTLIGGGGNDTLYGDGQIGADTHGVGGSGPITTFADVGLLGGVSGNDTLEGGLGNDTLNGGGGTDTASYANASGSVTVDLGAGSASGADGTDTLISIENVTGSAFNDQLTGNSGDNVISGGADNDTLNGRSGNDTLVGGTGIDTATYANASGGVTVSLIAGTASGADGNDTLATIENVTGSLFADSITGDANANLLSGGDGNDTLNGRTGNDTLVGGNGVDTASYANATGGVTVNLNTGSATGADGTDTLSLVENATGSAFADTLRGDDNANVLKGGAGSDALLGGRGDDSLYGGAGNDTMTGNQGNDRFVMEAGSGNDTITDFADTSDKIAFAGVSGVDDFSDLTLTKVGSTTVITWGTTDSLTINGYKPNQLHASDFEFSAAAAASTQEVSREAIGAGGYGDDSFLSTLHSTSLEVPQII